MRRALPLVLAVLLLLTGCTMAKGLTKDEIGENWLVLNYGTAEKPNYKKVAEVNAPEGFVPLTGVTSNTSGLETELYFVPEAQDSDIRFFYYTTGGGDSAALAAKLPEMYASFYEEFTADDARTLSIDGRDWLVFSYICAYNNQSESALVYEQSAVCYQQLTDNGYVACIVSMQYDDAGDAKSASDLDALIEKAVAAVAFQ